MDQEATQAFTIRVSYKKAKSFENDKTFLEKPARPDALQVFIAQSLLKAAQEVE